MFMYTDMQNQYLFTVIKYINNRLKSIIHFVFSSFQSSYQQQKTVEN